TLDALVASLLEKSPQKRIGHASDVALSLREVMGELGLEVPEVRGGPPRPYLYRPELSGRQELISRFENTAVEAVLGRGGVLPVVGESGAGKTRVLLEFARRANAMGMTVIGSECAAVIAEQRRGGQAAPLTPLRPFLGFIVDQVRQTKDPALTAFVERRGAVLRRYEPRFYELEGVRRLPAAPALAAEAERGRVFAALREGFVEVSKQRSVLLVIDDLQWADELSLGMLSATGADFFARIPVLVVTAYRAEETSDELSLALRQFAKDEMAVGRLDDSSVSQMVSDMLGTPETKGRFAHSLTQVSEGNPFFVAEYLRAAVAEGLVYRQRSGAWQVTDAERDLENALGLPHSLRDLVERRIAALSPESLRVARAIAVLGREASLRVLSEVLESEPEDLSESVHHLAQRQVLTEDTPGVLRFVHDQLREVVYAKTRPGERSALHGRVAGVIERRFRNTPNFAGWYAPLAAHFEQAGRGAEAGEYFERAGAHALRVGAPKDAIFSVTRAVALASELPAQARGIRARRLRILGDAQYALGNLHEATQQYLSVLEQLGEPAPRNLRGWVGLLSRTSLQELGAAVRMRAVGRRTRPRKELAEAAMAAQRIAERYYFTNDAFRIVTASLQAAHLARRSETALSRPHFQLGIAAGVGGLTGIAERCFSAGRASARESGDDYGRIMGAYTEIAYLSGRAQWQRVWQVGAEVLPVAENLGDPHELDLLNTVLANAAAFTGDFHRSAEDFLQIRDRARARGNPVHEAWGLYARAAALIALGSHSRAVGDLEDALELLRGRSDVASEIISYGLLAQARFRSGQYEGAKAAADDAAQRIHSRMPAVYSTLHGFHRAAEVYLRLWQHSRRSDTKLQQEGLRCLRKLRLFARLMPFGTSAALQTRALVCGPAPAARLLQRAADAARGSGMPYYEATALLDLSRVSLDAEQRRRSRDAAHALFLRMGCDYDAGLCRAEA
ncbi:MAG TPA: AAA family ATPase, partial [Polyangiaceae bacterium]|nr:AAA family ATPase [Polyangiaceae bacterium]